jgi:hypothetical protein
MLLESYVRCDFFLVQLKMRHFSALEIDVDIVFALIAKFDLDAATETIFLFCVKLYHKSVATI